MFKFKFLMSLKLKKKEVNWTIYVIVLWKLFIRQDLTVTIYLSSI